jgi:hypothetical protein
MEYTKQMHRRTIFLAAAATLVGQYAFAETQDSSPQSKWVKTHQVVIQVDSSDPAIMNLALNNAENMRRYYAGKDEKIEIEFVAFGDGLRMMRADTSPVKDRVAALSKAGIKFSGCGNTLANQSHQEGHALSLLPEASIVPTGVARIVELEEAGWTYLRP